MRRRINVAAIVSFVAICTAVRADGGDEAETHRRFFDALQSGAPATARVLSAIDAAMEEKCGSLPSIRYLNRIAKLEPVDQLLGEKPPHLTVDLPGKAREIAATLPCEKSGQ